MGERHTRQNQSHSAPAGNRIYRRKGGKAEVGAKDGDFVHPLFCWCGEQHSKPSEDPKYWSAGMHPWPPLDDPEAEVNEVPPAGDSKERIVWFLRSLRDADDMPMHHAADIDQFLCQDLGVTDD